ncbi:MAG: hypothetical protein AAF682_27700 [Planctomycetota bacterium]
MSARGVLIIGSGKRVREAGLPALHRLPQDFEVRMVLARTAKELEADGRTYAVHAIDRLDAAALDGVGLVYLAVTKNAVPDVLRRLATLDVGGVDLLIDTPVVRFKHFRHIALLDAFRAAWVAEDCAYLPWLDPVRKAVAAGAIGEVEGALFYQSAYAYHGVATAKALLGDTRVKRARRRKMEKGFGLRELQLAGGKGAWIFEPRDYSVGRVALLGRSGSIADFEHDGPGHLQLSPVVEDGDVTGLRLGDEVTAFDDDEVQLLRGDAPELGLTARMDALKRVGFLRLLRAIAAGRGGYPIDDAIDDMVVDYYLEKLGRYLATPLTESRSGIARGLLKLVTRAGG